MCATLPPIRVPHLSLLSQFRLPGYAAYAPHPTPVNPLTHAASSRTGLTVGCLASTAPTALALSSYPQAHPPTILGLFA